MLIYLQGVKRVVGSGQVEGCMYTIRHESHGLGLGNKTICTTVSTSCTIFLPPALSVVGHPHPTLYGVLWFLLLR